MNQPQKTIKSFFAVFKIDWICMKEAKKKTKLIMGYEAMCMARSFLLIFGRKYLYVILNKADSADKRILIICEFEEAFWTFGNWKWLKKLLWKKMNQSFFLILTVLWDLLMIKSPKNSTTSNWKSLWTPFWMTHLGESLKNVTQTSGSLIFIK